MQQKAINRVASLKSETELKVVRMRTQIKGVTPRMRGSEGRGHSYRDPPAYKKVLHFKPNNKKTPNKDNTTKPRYIYVLLVGTLLTCIYPFKTILS